MKKIFFLIVFVLFFGYLFSPLIFGASIGTTTTWNVATNLGFTLTYGIGCSSSKFFFDENSAFVDSDVDGNATKILPYSSRRGQGGAVCQLSTVAGITVTNTGNVTLDIDGNFTTDFYANGLDTNIWLKVWEGTGSGCGLDAQGNQGMGGWSLRCPVVSAFDDVTQTNCRDFNSSNALTRGLLVNGLAAGDTNQLCFSGEFMAAVIGQTARVGQGDHNGIFQAYSYEDTGE